MGLRQTCARWRHVYGWRLRHWWMDTLDGRQAKIGLGIVGLLVLVAWTVYFTMSWLQPEPHTAKHSVVVAVVLLIIAIVAAIVAYATMPKPKDQPAKQADTPVTQDGQQVRRAFGTVWVDDSFLLAWQVTARDPIKADSGK